MKSTQVIVEISPSRLELAVMKGSRVVASRCERAAGAEFGAWPEVLGQLRPRLAKWVAELALSGQDATVVYAAPTSATGVFSCPLTAGQAGSERAALLALGEIASFLPEDHAHDVAHVMTDCPFKGAAKTPDAAPPSERRVHTLATADREETALALHHCLEEAGLRAARLVPIDAAAMALVVRQIMARPADAAPTAIMWFGEHSSVLAAGNARGLRFIRNLGIGIDSLVEAVTRPLRGGPGSDKNTGEKLVTLDRVSARRVLARVGIPTPEDVVDAELAIVGSAVLPHMQPALQRFAVEIKQSLRFGLLEAERAGVTLRVIGPGVGVKRLAETIGMYCGIAAEAAPTAREPCPDAPSYLPPDAAGEQGTPSAQMGAIAAWAACGKLDVNLVPIPVRQAGVMRRVRMGMFAGLGAAAALVGVFAITARLALAAENRKLVELTSQAEAVRQRHETQSSARAAAARVTKIEQRIGHEMGDGVDMAQVLALVAQAAPNAIKLTSLDIVESSTHGMTCQIAGYTSGVAEDGESFAATLKQFTDALSAAPIIHSVTLGSTARQSIHGQDARRFELSVSLVTLPGEGRVATSRTATPGPAKPAQPGSTTTSLGAAQLSAAQENGR